MTTPASCLFAGDILHRRYKPKRHALSYHVHNVFLDVDQLAAISKPSWLFGYNQKKLFGINDLSHGDGSGRPIAEQAWALMHQLPRGCDVSRIFMFCYPNVLGHIFNPLTIYFGFNIHDEICAAIYEVNNFHGERHSYVLPVSQGVGHEAAKMFYVSPFNTVAGTYHFNIIMEEDRLRINIALLNGREMKLCARFVGRRAPLNDAALAKSILSLTVQPAKVVAAILWESAKLYFKGLRLVVRPTHPKWSGTVSGANPMQHVEG